MTNHSERTQAAQPAPRRRFWHYLYHSLQLKCPICGQSPLFCPLSQVRSLHDWYVTLPGCPRCNYVYDPEPGYFLLAFWMFDYGFAGLFGIALFLTLYNYFDLAMLQVLWITLAAVTVFAVFIVRHCKALFLAMDHYLLPRR